MLFRNGGDIEAILQRLDRLTQDEARMTVTQTLEIVSGLVNNVKLEVGHGQYAWLAVLIRDIPLNCPLVDNNASIDGIRQALCMFRPRVSV